jgi:hypothetical protein
VVEVLEVVAQDLAEALVVVTLLEVLELLILAAVAAALIMLVHRQFAQVVLAVQV